MHGALWLIVTPCQWEQMCKDLVIFGCSAQTELSVLDVLKEKRGKVHSPYMLYVR